MKAIQILKNIHEFEHLSAYAEFIAHDTIEKLHRLHFGEFYYTGKTMNPDRVDFLRDYILNKTEEAINTRPFNPFVHIF